MPENIRTPNNPSGRMQRSAWDDIEAGNRGAMMQNRGLEQNDMMAKLAIARLQSDDYRYAQDRSDKIGYGKADLDWRKHALDTEAGLTREGWGRDDGRWNKQWDFMQGQAQTEEGWRQKFYDDGQTGRTAQNEILSAQSGLMQQLLAEQKAAAERQAAANASGPEIANLSPELAAKRRADVGSGVAPAQADLNVINAQKEKTVTGNRSAIAALGRKAGDFHARDTNWVPSWLGGDEDPDAFEWSKMALDSQNLAQQIAKTEGISLDEAKALVAAELDARAPARGGTADATKDFRKYLGW